MEDVAEDESEKGLNVNEKMEDQKKHPIVSRQNIKVNINVTNLNEKKKKKKKKKVVKEEEKVKVISPNLLDILFSFIGVSTPDNQDELKFQMTSKLNLYSDRNMN